MTPPQRSRLLVVDDEEAILETMTFTFEDDYDVLTSSSAEKALRILEENAPVAVVISDQRMPEMTGVDFLARVYEGHPNTVRIILTGFADMDATISAINKGHVYAYITKPWEPDQLKQVVRRAVDFHVLSVENERLLRELRDANRFLEAVMDRTEVGALALDASGVVREANRPAREYLGLEHDPRGRELKEILGVGSLGEVAAATTRIAAGEGETFEEVPLSVGDCSFRLRVRMQKLTDPDGREIGSVIFLREISHEPLRMRFDELLAKLSRQGDGLRSALDQAQTDLRRIGDEARSSKVESAGMADLGDRVARTVTAIDHWCAVDDALVREDFPDAQVLRERMRIANSRWPMPDKLPSRVRELARRVESYYESGEHPKQSTL